MLEPDAVKALGEILLIVGVKFSREMQPDLVDKSRKIDPAAHGFARTAGINDIIHGNIIRRHAGSVKGNCAGMV